ncbi:hypothetical protein IE4872_PD02350 (plasmid) [Rhizobium gallicum]|uniref:Uncharacterized protein n=1 Tax=Rhizobium gallicum TaxID=56730 RepID=A0A1L5NYA3_9HYPH|nr:hypothetical protein IE4872_PD02350 [Rhizobium gallicum]
MNDEAMRWVRPQGAERAILAKLKNNAHRIFTLRTVYEALDKLLACLHRVHLRPSSRSNVA